VKYDIQPENKANIITKEVLEAITEEVIDKCERMSSNKKHLSALNYLTALTNYNDNLLNYPKNEKRIQVIIKESFQQISIRAAVTPFLNVQADSKIQSSKKLALKIMKDFHNAYNKDFKFAAPYQLVKILQKYTSHNWMLADTYNNIILNLGNRFDDFAIKELVQICSSLAQIGLRQEDIFSETLKKIESKYGEDNVKHSLGFNTIIVPLFKASADASLTEFPFFQTLISDKFNNDCISGDHTFFEHALADKCKYPPIKPKFL
jgi:hypothetical protein